MARPSRNRLEFNEESLNDLLQEIYDDTHRIRQKIVRLFTKWEIKVKENGEVAAIGDQIVKLIIAETKNQDQKIMLLKYLKDIIFDKNKEEALRKANEERNEILRMQAEKNNNQVNEQNEPEPEEVRDLSDERRNELLDMVHQEMIRLGKLK